MVLKMVNKDIEMAKKIASIVKKEVNADTYFVGGFVRDKFLGKENKDVDIEIHGITPEKLEEVLSRLGKLDLVGRSFSVWKLHGYDLDISIPRRERAIGLGHRDFEVISDGFMGIEEACKRRDLTINAMMLRVLDDVLVDPFNGKQDLEAGIIRHVDEKTFVEDPLRVLRVAQFSARLQFSVAPETVMLCSKMDLTQLPKERIWGELQKALLKSSKPSVFFEVLDSMNQLDFWFPEVKSLQNVEQNLQYHPEGNVWNHTMMVLDVATSLKSQSSNYEAFMLTALCHDFGKTIATAEVDGVLRALQHETLGLPIIENFLDRVVNEVKIKKYVMNMTELHMSPNQCFANKSKMKTTNRLFDKSVNPKDLVLFAEADHMGRLNPSDFTATKQWLMERVEHFDALLKTPEVQGRDLVKAGLKPGPHFTEALKLAHQLFTAEVPFDKALPQVIALAKREERRA